MNKTLEFFKEQKQEKKEEEKKDNNEVATLKKRAARVFKNAKEQLDEDMLNKSREYDPEEKLNLLTELREVKE